MQSRHQAVGPFTLSKMEVDGATSGGCSLSTLSASAVLAAGPVTFAPKSSRCFFTASPTSASPRPRGYLEPFRSSGDPELSGWSWSGEDMDIPFLAGSSVVVYAFMMLFSHTIRGIDVTDSTNIPCLAGAPDRVRKNKEGASSQV